MTSRSILSVVSRRDPNKMSEAALAYDSVGANYLHYADGNSRDIFDFGGRYSYGDQRVWASIEAKLVAMAEAGYDKLTVLDVGCGPGTWLRRVVTRANALGIPKIDARGFDLSGEQIAIARRRSRDLQELSGVRLRFEHGNLTKPLPEADASVDLCLCLNAVINHIEVDTLPRVAAELSRVTGGFLVSTVRATGSQPSIFVDDIDQAAKFYQDNDADRLTIDFLDGRHVEFNLHLFKASELKALFAPHIEIINLCGLDLLHSRFTPDPRWNPAEGAEEEAFHEDLERLERTLSTDPHFIDHATHLLMVCEPQHVCEG